MKIIKIQAVILALILFSLPILSIKEAKALGTEYTVVRGQNLTLERPKYVGQGDNIKFIAKYTGGGNPTLVLWNWDVCGTKQTVSNKQSYAEKTVKMNKEGNCKVTVQVSAFYSDYGIPGWATDNVNVLPVRIVPITLTAPKSAKVGQTFWVEALHSEPVSFRNSKTVWSNTATGACTGSAEIYGARTMKIGEKGDRKGACKITTTLNIYESGYILRASEVRNVTIN